MMEGGAACQAIFCALQNHKLSPRLAAMNLSLQKALALQKRDKVIIRQARRMNLAEIARLHGLTRERVRQIVKTAAPTA